MAKVYELPIAENYVHNWNTLDAVREIMQNAIDSKTDGNKLHVYYSNGLLTIGNSGCNLDISDLVLGVSGKHDTTKYIGTYGEGFKLAIVVLLRNGISVKIRTNKQIWTPEFKLSTKFKTTTLHINVESDTTIGDQVTFELGGISQDLFDVIRTKNLAISEALGYSTGEKLETEYGNILLNPIYKGKMFVNGLYIQTDDSFKYGYDFKPEYLQLDRDRKAINYYKMRELTAKAMTAQTDVQLVHKAITSHYVDVRDIIDHMNEISTEFKVNFATEFLKSHDLDEDTFVGLDKEVKIANKPKSFKTDSQTIAQLVNAGLKKEDEYKKIQQKVKDLDKAESARVSYDYSDFQTLINYLASIKDKLDIPEVIELLTDLTGLHTSNFMLIKDEVFKIFTDDEE